jgi:hypothetical protein
MICYRRRLLSSVHCSLLFDSIANNMTPKPDRDAASGSLRLHSNVEIGVARYRFGEPAAK